MRPGDAPCRCHANLSGPWSRSSSTGALEVRDTAGRGMHMPDRPSGLPRAERGDPRAIDAALARLFTSP